jgi:hypothetical protein
MNDSSRTQGLLICAGAVVVALVFLSGLLRGAWWSVAVPVAVLLAFVLGLTFWVGFTIATVQVEPEPDPDAPAEDAPLEETTAPPVASRSTGAAGSTPPSPSGAGGASDAREDA